MLNLFILNPSKEQRTLLIKELKKHPDAWEEYQRVLKSEEEVPLGEIMLVADRISTQLIAMSFSLTEKGINPFALTKSLGILHKIFLTNSLSKEINMNWELNKITKEEIEELEIDEKLLEMMK